MDKHPLDLDPNVVYTNISSYAGFSGLHVYPKMWLFKL